MRGQSMRESSMVLQGEGKSKWSRIEGVEKGLKKVASFSIHCDYRQIDSIDMLKRIFY